MAYEKHTWIDKETITAEKLNNIEEGIAASGTLICNVTYDSIIGKDRLDKTVQEIYDALIAGIPAYIIYNYGAPSDYQSHLCICPIIRISTYNDAEFVRVYASKAKRLATVDGLYEVGAPALLTFLASGLNAYPVYYASPYVSTTYLENGTIYE